MGSLRGAGGFDGWTSKELHQMPEHLPWLFVELHELLQCTIKAAEVGLPKQLVDSFFACRVPCIPKKTLSETRPIAIVSVIARAWERPLLPWLPGADADQSCGRKASRQ